jgi:hypothetical protein
MGSLYKRGRIWWMAYMIDGKQRPESTGTRNKRLAQKILDKREGEIVEGRFRLPKSNPPTLDKWAAQFLESIPPSRVTAKPAIRGHFKSGHGKVPGT